MNVKQLVSVLKTLPSNWRVSGTSSGSIWVCEAKFKWEAGQRYGYVFPYERSKKEGQVKLYTVRPGARAVERQFGLTGLGGRKSRY